MMKKTRQGFILMQLSRGAVISVSYLNDPPSAVRRTYRLSSTGELLREDTVMRMVDEKLIRPNADGLFGNDGPPQSYSLFRASEGGA